MKTNKIIYSIICLFCFTPLFSQNIKPKGVLIDVDRKPIDVFSIVIFNLKDTTTQVYANTFSSGNFNLDFEPLKGEKYGVCLLSVGYEESYLKLNELKDTIILKNKSIKIDDVVVKGKRDVKIEIGTYGGVAYDVSNTYLSNMGTSTKLLNFIPGVTVSDLGDVKLLNSRDNVVVYINNVKIENTEKLLSLKSEDIKSVEVITTPVARFKGAKAVLYIKTNRAVDGFSSRVSNLYMVGDRMTYEAPSVEMTFTKKKVTVSGAYRYTYHDNMTNTDTKGRIDEAVYKGGWQIHDIKNSYSTENSHWYSTNIHYAINKKNTLLAEYTGLTEDNRTRGFIDQKVSTSDKGIVYNNILAKKNDPKNNNNRIHLNYIGEYSEKFNIIANIDFSNRINKNYYTNNWFINDIITGKQSEDNFSQNELSNGYAITSEVIFNNTIKDRHKITYGLEHSYLRDDVSSTITDKTNSTSKYYLNSNFLKLIAEYAYTINSKTSTTFGLNYMYSYLKDNNSGSKGENYNNLAPYITINYYNTDKDLGLNFSISYKNTQPTAGNRNESIVIVNSPYEISRGNSDIHNSIGYFSNFSLTYKKFGISLNAMFLTKDLINGTIVEDNNGKPLFVNTYVNEKKPITNVDLGISYANKISFWSTSIYASLTYALFNLEQAENIFEKTSGFRSDIYMNNEFKLPLNFYIYLNGYYRTRGYQYMVLFEPTFNVDLSIEKRFLKDNLTISIKGSGILAEKYNEQSYKEFGIYNRTIFDGYGTRRCFSINASWRFNNHKKVQQAKDNEYLNML